MNPDKTPAAASRRLRAWHIVAAVALVAVLDVYIMLVSAPALETLNGGRTIFDLRFGYSPETARRLIAGFGEGSWRVYTLWHTAPDTLLAIVEGVALVMICLRATRPGGRFRSSCDLGCARPSLPLRWRRPRLISLKTF